MDLDAPIPTVTLPDGRVVPSLGLGPTLLDTAEMYADGGAETVVGEAIAGLGDRPFVVSKGLPSNASAAGTVAACERSLKRLRRERIDLYLLHWPGRHPLAGTVEAFERPVAQGKIGAWGVSNVDADGMRELAALPAGARCATNQAARSRRRPARSRSRWPDRRGPGPPGRPAALHAPVYLGGRRSRNDFTPSA